MQPLLGGKTAIVTGAARGLGAAISIAFAREGANVVLNSRSDSRALEHTLKCISNLGGKAVASIGNVSDAKYVAAELVAAAKDEFGGVDILVNNAGIIRDKPINFLKESEWDEVLDTNLKGAFLCSKAVIKPMIIGGGGRIINISSITALSGRVGQTNYGASKAGLIGLTKSLAREVARYNILVNAAVVGVIETRMTKQIPPAALREILEMIPLGRMGTPDEVANACLFLASDMSSYVTGTTINISGGGYI